MSDIKELNDRMAMDFRVGVPCVITEYNPEFQCATVTPAYKERIMGENGREVIFEEMQPILEVPIADVAGIRFIPEDGAHGWLYFSDIDLQAYITTRDALQDLHTATFHDYNDCFCIVMDIAKIDRPLPYMTIGCDVVKIHKQLEVDEGIIAEGDVAANGGEASLVGVKSNTDGHDHIDSMGGATSSLGAAPGSDIEIIECPAVEGEGGEDGDDDNGGLPGPGLPGLPTLPGQGDN